MLYLALIDNFIMHKFINISILTIIILLLVLIFGIVIVKIAMG